MTDGASGVPRIHRAEHRDRSLDQAAECRRALREELEQARADFHEVRSRLSDQDSRARSLNSGWTNGEIMFHATFAFILVSRLAPMIGFWSRLPAVCSLLFAGFLNLLPAAFNVVNAFVARAGARVYSRKRIGRRYDRAYESILSLLSKVPDDDWCAGMYYPTRWDGLFNDYMTLVDVVRYPIRHFHLHVRQLSQPA